MNPFDKFSHFIAYFIPGVVLFVAVLMLVSILIGVNLLLVNGLFSTGVLMCLITASILGLFIDEFRHTFLENSIEKCLLESLGYDSEKIQDFTAYIPQGLNIELYKLICDDYFYFYEFDVNISMTLFLVSIIIYPYLSIFFYLPSTFLFSTSISLFVLSCLFLYMGKNAYRTFLTTLFDTMENIKPGFKKTIS
jgi:hypothetical protein